MDLVAFDMNGVLTKSCLAHVLSEKYAPQGMTYWNRYRRGELDVADVVTLVGGTHRGLAHSLIEEEALRIPPADHHLELMRKLREGGFGFVIASVDYLDLVKRVALALAPYEPLLTIGNEAVYDGDGVHTGIIQDPIIEGMEKARRVDGLRTSTGAKRLISIGDDPTCHSLFCISDISIAYNSRDGPLREIATHCIDDGDLLDVAELLEKIC